MNYKQYLMATTKSIRQIRKEAGMTQEQLARRMNVSVSMISQWENGVRNPKQETMQRIISAIDQYKAG